MYGGYLGDFDDDPFLGLHMRSMQQMSNMMNSMFDDPFGMMGGFGMAPRHPAIRNHSRDMMPFGAGGFGMQFPDIGRLMSMTANDPNCHSYSSSTVMAMSSGPNGQPQVYQASQSTRTGPGGVKETKKSVADSRTGTKKLAIGHHIGDKSHIIEKEKNLRTGEEEEREEFINLEEDEADTFSHEFESRTRSTGNAITNGARHHRQLPELTSSTSSTNRSVHPHHGVIIEEITDEDETEKPRKRERKESSEEDSECEVSQKPKSRKSSHRSKV